MSCHKQNVLSVSLNKTFPPFLNNNNNNNNNDDDDDDANDDDNDDDDDDILFNSLHVCMNGYFGVEYIYIKQRLIDENGTQTDQT